jgi:error-prone DNA polymerase
VFVELLGRSCFSFLRGASHPEEMIRSARDLGISGLALCDLDGIYGAVRAWKAHKEAARFDDGGEGQAFQYIVGAELTLAHETSAAGIPRVPPDHTALTVALLVQNAAGYANLCRLLTRSHEGQDKGVSVCHPAWFSENHEGLFALLVAPKDPRRLTPTMHQERTLLTLKEAFLSQMGVAIYRHLDGLDRLRQSWALATSEMIQAPVVASARPLFHTPERKPLADVLHCIREGTSLDEAGAFLSANGEQSLRSEVQMKRLFRDHPEWVAESARIAQTCTFDFGELKYHFPCHLPDGQTADERLAELTWEGVGRRYPQGISAALRSQIKKELRLIKTIGVAPYFLSTYDIVEIARSRKILCQGRGSAANSAVCFMLGITAVDPSRSQLLFERFLSEERAEPPDIDIDFEHERREEVIQEIYERYGRERAAMVSEIISYRSKSALREVSQVFGLSLEQADALSGTVTWRAAPEDQEKRLLEAGFDLKDPRLKQVIFLAEQLRGFPRHLSIHVGGFVLSSRPLYEVAPVEPARMEGRTVIPWDKDDIDALGFFKVDVLALGMLTAIRKALELIRKDGGLQRLGGVPASTASLGKSPIASEEAEEEPFDPLEVITRIPAEDVSTYRMISRGDTVGVFQIESRAQMAMLPRLRPSCFYDLVIEVAIVRPGPIQGGMVHPFLRRRNKEEEITCPHPDLWPILERTLGVPLFQEQVMQIAITGAGYSGGEADQLRRDMAAWKKHGRLLEHRERLLAGFRKKGIPDVFGEALFEQIKGFGEYGFPESHASSFALLVYASSWEKRHYPAHFCCALLNSQPMGFYEPTTLVRDAKAHGVEVRDVCIVRSDWDSTLEEPDVSKGRVQSQAPGAERALRLGFRQLRGLGEECARRIVRARTKSPFASLHDVIHRARLKKDEVELLATAGAFEQIEEGRRHALWRSEAPRTPGLFEGISPQEEFVAFPPLSAPEQLVLDYGTKGLSVDDHPLRHHRKRLSKLGAARAADLLYLPRGHRVAVAGLVMARQRPATAGGVVFMTIEDETGSANLIVYAPVFEKFHHVARNAQMLFVTGRIERDARLPIPERVVSERVVSERVVPDVRGSQESTATGVEVGRSHEIAGDDVARDEDAVTPVIHVIVEHMEKWDNNARPDLRFRSRDFH